MVTSHLLYRFIAQHIHAVAEIRSRGRPSFSSNGEHATGISQHTLTKLRSIYNMSTKTINESCNELTPEIFFFNHVECVKKLGYLRRFVEGKSIHVQRYTDRRDSLENDFPQFPVWLPWSVLPVRLDSIHSFIN